MTDKQLEKLLDAQTAKLTKHLDSAIAAQDAKLDSAIAAQDAKLDSVLAAQDAKLNSVLAAQDAKLDAQTLKLVKYIDVSISNSTAPIIEELANINGKLDNLCQVVDNFIGRTTDLEDEFGFMGKQTTEKLSNHETRIHNLELTTR